MSTGRLFAIGDIHGCKAELDNMIMFLCEAEGLNQNDLVIFMGDYIDKGPDSLGVLESLAKFKEKFPKTIFLCGNHEYVVCVDLGIKNDPLSFKKEGDELFNHIKEKYYSFFENLQTIVEIEDFIFVHGRLDKRKSLEDQSELDVIFSREQISIFEQNEYYKNKTVIYGHTPKNVLTVCDNTNSIGIDTGCCVEDGSIEEPKLTCINLTEKEVYCATKVSRSNSIFVFKEKDLISGIRKCL
jgi:serine/threonine protein phosphatase 1